MLPIGAPDNPADFPGPNQERLGYSLFIRLYSIHVPGTISAEDLRCRLQEMPARRSDWYRRIPIPIDRRRMPIVR